MKFSYIVLGSDNKEQRGVTEAANIRAATQLLLDKGWFIKKLTPKGKAGRGLAEISFGGIPLIERVLFTKHLAMMMKSGISLNESLDSIQEQMRSRKFKRIINSLLSRLRGGQSLAASLQLYPKVFNELYINIVKVGEESGTLEKNLEHLASDLEDQLELRRKVRSAALYPAIILVSTFALGLVITYFVLPKITKLFKTLNFELPLTTKILLGVSSAMETHGLLIIGGIVGGVILLRVIFKRKFIRPFSHLLLLRLPIIGSITRNYNLATINRTLSILLKAGLPIDQAVTVGADTTVNVVYRQRLKKSVEQIRKGKRLSIVLADSNRSKRSPLFPLLTVKMISIGERSGRMDESFAYVAEYFEKEVDTAMKNLTTVLEPLLLVFIGLVVGFIAISVISPIYQITGQIRR